MAAVLGWSWEEDKAFEDALAEALPFGEGEEGEDDRRWEEIAAKVAGRTAAEVRRHYEVLVEDVRSIEAGKVPSPCYLRAEKDREGGRAREQQLSGAGVRKGGGQVGGGGGFGVFDNSGGGGQGRGGSSKAEQERRKGIPWTEEEHKLFLLGLDKFGKGDWRSISRNFVISRTPTQVASHAQKYFIRLNSMNRDRRRASIHDITSVVNAAAAAAANGSSSMISIINGGTTHDHHHVSSSSTSCSPAVTGAAQMMNAAGAAHHLQLPAAGHQPPMPLAGSMMAAMYAAPPAVGHMVSAAAAVGTPVCMRPPPGHPPYIIPVAYPVPPTMHHP